MKKILLISLVVVTTAFAASAQGRLDLRINEVMVNDTSNIPDQYGHRVAWIEIFNASHGTNGIEKMFITNDVKYRGQKKLDVDKEKKANPMFHEIRRGDVATKVAPRTHVVFFADGDIARGTFHLPFKLEPGKDNYIGLFDVNGDLVDEVVVPASLPIDNSYARLSEEKIDLHKASREFDAKDWQVRDGSSDSLAITPRKFNARPVNSNIDKFYKNDSHGWILTLFAMGIVFSALALLFISFLIFGKIFQATENKAKAAAEAEPAAIAEESEHNAQPGSNDEAIAAICMALYQHLNAHDVESGVLTFDHSHDMPSAWGSKGNLLMPTPEHH